MKSASVVLFACLALAAPAAAQSPIVITPPATTTAPAVVPSGYVQPAPADEVEEHEAQPGVHYYATPQYVVEGRRQRTILGRRHVTANDSGLWGLGLGLFLGGWGLDIALTAVGNALSHDRDPAVQQDAQAWSILPIAGPIVELAIQAPHPAIPIFAGLMQISGLVCFVLGMTSTHDAEVPIYAFGDPHDARTARIGLQISPMQGGGYASLALHL